MKDQKRTRCFFCEAKSKIPILFSFERNFPLLVIKVKVYSPIQPKKLDNSRKKSPRSFKNFSKKVLPDFFLFGKKCDTKIQKDFVIWFSLISIEHISSFVSKLNTTFIIINVIL